jgi:trehalose-phosphatase
VNYIEENESQKNQPSYFFEKINDCENLLKNNQRIILFLDYDGTLVYFKNHPSMVQASSDLIHVLNRLISKKSIEIVIITGRSLNQIKSQLPIRGLHFAANHGLIIELAKGTTQIVKEAKKIKSQVKKIKNEVKGLFSKQENIFIEDKTYSLAFHYRAAPKEKVPSLKNKFIKIVSKNDDNSIDLIEGDNVIEARPKGWNKANAVKFFLNSFNHDTVLYPIYIGDDTTDEDAFQFFNDEGLTIYVKNDSSLQSYASYWVKNPSEVLQFLKVLEHSISSTKRNIFSNKEHERKVSG